MAKVASEREQRLRTELVSMKDLDRRIKSMIVELKAELKKCRPAPKPKQTDVKWLESLWKLEGEK